MNRLDKIKEIIDQSELARKARPFIATPLLPDQLGTWDRKVLEGWENEKNDLALALDSALPSEGLVPLDEDVEKLSSEFHDVYIAEAKRQGDVRHKDRYEDLSENVKEFDRVLARYVLKRFGTASLKEGESIKQAFIQKFCNDHNEKVRWLRGVSYSWKTLLTDILEFFDEWEADRRAIIERMKIGEEEK